MEEFDLDNITPEMVLENMKKNGEIDEESYTEVKFQFEDIEDVGVLNDYQIFEKAYKNNRIHKCVEMVLKIALENSNNLKKCMLRSNCLKNPMGMKYTETDYKKTMQIMINAFKKAEEMKFENQIVSQIGEMLLYTHGFYHNSQTNTQKLEMNTFSQYSLSKQLRMICIFIQDQSRLMKEELYKSRKKSFRTGMEMNIANRPVDHFPQEKISFSDNYEGMLEYFNTIIHFVYYSKKKDLKKNDIGEHGDIHPFGIPEFEQLTYIAQQRRMYELLEEKFRYGEWGVELVHNQNNQNVYLFKPERKDKFKSHITASIRREYQYKSNITRYANFQKVERAMVAVEKLALQIEIDNIEKFEVDRRLYKEATEVVSSLITVYRDLTKKYYFQCKFDGITVDDLINMYEFLYTYSQIYMESASKHFNQDDYTTYKYIVPVVSLEYLLNEFVLLYGYERNLAKKLLDNFVYHEHLKKEEGDIFSRPLLKVNKSKVLLCESLIEQINIERNVEQWLKKYDVDLTPVGYQFEDKLRKKLGSINGIEVNTNKFTFNAYDGKDVEFDFIGTFDDYLLLFEFKSVLIPYDESEVLKREGVIKEGVEQIKRRCEIVKYDWDKIRENVNISLPEKTYPEDRIIKLVCTNVYDFTTLVIDGIMITDESTLLKYFTDPFVAIYSKESRMTEVLSAEFLWKDGKPSVSEFVAYLKKPVTIGQITECLEDEIKTIPAFEDDYLIAFEDVCLSKDPFRETINQKRQIIKGKKIYPNDPCPCGSGKKYKKCCGK